MKRILCIVLLSAAAQAAPCQDLPILFIVQDKSGSMAGVPDPVYDPNAPSKWMSAKATVPPLTAQFSNRFRFGVMMFPDAATTFNCTTGTTRTAVPSTPSQVQYAYDNAAPGGG